MQRRILVVEDDIDILLILVAAARERGYEATGTIDASDVIRYIRGNRPDLVLLDLNMPRTDGRDLLVRIRAEPAPARVIVVTGWIDEHTHELCRTYGAVDVITKPFDLDDLFARVTEVL